MSPDDAARIYSTAYDSGYRQGLVDAGSSDEIDPYVLEAARRLSERLSAAPDVRPTHRHRFSHRRARPRCAG